MRQRWYLGIKMLFLLFCFCRCRRMASVNGVIEQLPLVENLQPAECEEVRALSCSSTINELVFTWSASVLILYIDKQNGSWLRFAMHWNYDTSCESGKHTFRMFRNSPSCFDLCLSSWVGSTPFVITQLERTLEELTGLLLALRQGKPLVPEGMSALGSGSGFTGRSQAKLSRYRFQKTAFETHSFGVISHHRYTDWFGQASVIEERQLIKRQCQWFLYFFMRVGPCQPPDRAFSPGFVAWNWFYLCVPRRELSLPNCQRGPFSSGWRHICVSSLGWLGHHMTVLSSSSFHVVC